MKNHLGIVIGIGAIATAVIVFSQVNSNQSAAIRAPIGGGGGEPKDLCRCTCSVGEKKPVWYNDRCTDPNYDYPEITDSTACAKKTGQACEGYFQSGPSCTGPVTGALNCQFKAIPQEE